MSDCTEIQSECLPLPRVGEAWSICLPWGGRLWSDGESLHVQPGSPPPDGTYGSITIAGGCIVGVGPLEVPLYTGSPCAPQPSGCGDSSSGGGGSVTPSTVAGNLYTLDAVGRPLVRCNIQAGSGVSVSGTGTAADPFVISASGGGISVQSVYAKSGNNAITVTGQGTQSSPLTITHKTGKQGTVNGLVFDAYGHLIDGNSASAKGVQAIIPGDGIDAKTDMSTGAVTIAQRAPGNVTAGDYTFGGMKTHVDSLGRLSSLQQSINLGGDQTIRAGLMQLGINSYGSITSISQSTDLGSAYYLRWPKTSNTEAKIRGGKIVLPHAVGLCGIFCTDASSTLTKNLVLTLDNMPCLITSNVGGLITFVGAGIYAAGEHSFEATSETAWGTTAVACAILFAASPGSETWER